MLFTCDTQMLQMKHETVLHILEELKKTAPSKQENFELQQLINYNPLTKCPAYADFDINHKRFETFLNIKAVLESNQATASLICQNEKRKIATGRL